MINFEGRSQNDFNPTPLAHCQATMLTIGHRGLMGIAPENTLQSFSAALEHNVDIIEMDLCYFQGVVYVTHDPIQHKCEISQRNIPTLENVLELIDKRKPVYLDIKQTAVVAPLTKLLAKLITQGWPANQFYLASFNHHHIQAAMRVLPSVMYGFSYGCVPLNLSESAYRAGVNFIVLDYHMEYEQMLNSARRHMLQVFVYTVGSPIDRKACERQGVEGIFIDVPWHDERRVADTSCTLPQPYNKIGDGPEGPEVYVMTEKLRRRISEKKLISIEPLVDRYKGKIPTVFLNSLPLQVKDVFSKGKKTIVKFNKDMALLISYGMSGHWRFQSNKFAQLEFTFTNCKYFWTSSRSLPTCVVQFLTHQELQNQLNKLGLDIIHDDPSPEDVLELYGKSKKNICAFLMEQDKFCGIGNYIKAVILYRCRVSPHRKVSELDDGQRWLIWDTAQQVAREAIAAKGMGIRDYRDEDGNVVGVAFDITPYNKKFDGHGNPVVVVSIAGRSTWWVPAVQF